MVFGVESNEHDPRPLPSPPLKTFSCAMSPDTDIHMKQLAQSHANLTSIQDAQFTHKPNTGVCPFFHFISEVFIQFPPVIPFPAHHRLLNKPIRSLNRQNNVL